MDVKYKNNRIECLCNIRKHAVRKFGSERGEKVLKRTGEIRSAESLGDLERSVRASRPHCLSGKRKGEISIVVKDGLSIIVEPDMDENDYMIDGAINFYKITKLLIKNVEDYHDDKK